MSAAQNGPNAVVVVVVAGVVVYTSQPGGNGWSSQRAAGRVRERSYPGKNMNSPEGAGVVVQGWYWLRIRGWSWPEVLLLGRDNLRRQKTTTAWDDKVKAPEQRHQETDDRRIGLDAKIRQDKGWALGREFGEGMRRSQTGRGHCTPVGLGFCLASCVARGCRGTRGSRTRECFGQVLSGSDWKAVGVADGNTQAAACGCRVDGRRFLTCSSSS